MNVADLRKFVNTQLGLADDAAILVISGSDHELCSVEPTLTDAELHTKGRHLSEYFSDGDMEKGSKKIPVLLFS